MNIETCPECGVYCEPIDAEAFPKILLWKCPKCGAKYELRTVFRRVPQTNADQLRAMMDEELAEWLADTDACPCDVSTHYCLHTECNLCWLEWLRQEADT